VHGNELLEGASVAFARPLDQWTALHAGITPLPQEGFRARERSNLEMVNLVGINHVALEVGDIDEALAWYGRIFELELRGRIGDRMAFVDMGDQFIALARGRTQERDRARHFGLVVDDKEAARAALRDAGLEVGARGSLDFHDPWGNQVQVVDYREIQFTKAPEVARGMGLEELEKTDQALAELREKGLADGRFAE
jgi:lactoylglutathione lyase